MQINIIKLSIFIIICTVLSCKPTTKIVQTSGMDMVKEDIVYLSSDELEGRETGTKGEELAAIYISNRFKDMGLEGVFHGDNSYYQFFQKTKKSNPHATEPNPNDPVVKGRNVGAFKNNGSDHTIIIGAHYDHLGYGAEGSLHIGDPEIHNGADDNASGVAAMMALAEHFSDQKMKSNFLFMAFSGEEKGLWGSNFFVDNSPLELDDINYMINMDMVGRLNDERQLAIYGTGTSPVWHRTITSVRAPVFKFSMKESGVGPSDHTSFYLEDIPVLHFFTGQHEDYHRPSDDHWKLNYDGLNDIIRYISTIIVNLNDSGKLEFTKTKDESEQAPDFKVTLGVIPDYLYDGQGMRIDGVREGRPADNAGMIKGDIVKKMGELEIVDMMSYMKALGAFEKGQTIKAVIEREGEKKTVEVTF
ncbi:MAG: M28 family peptidase [Saprospiraceae bacterium]|nr:M28 family peptidase [Bacteroidia bacterium]NNF20557.1 M28 family peptidase [Saprospiraceae bacterium]